MAYLLKYLKEDLMLVAHEMGVEVSENYRKIDIKKEIIASKEYDEEVVKFQLDAMVEDRRVKMEREAQKIRGKRIRTREIANYSSGRYQPFAIGFGGKF
ncbi:hypothetical protein JTE90_025259 [Oedothorax gibbosus]|uniref:Uncharacterized protein n=1 Tax=Oedothorax gibbosus TaxID=931172 RepID=A0AAV6U8L5_9ARAC|nr:hypothetical protein JTE90_025259 [Oedothorax gibbosus]